MKAKKLKELLEKEKVSAKNIIDIREGYELQNGKVKNSKNVPMNTLIANPSKYLTKEEIYYLMCQTGVRSFSTSIILKLKGYKVKNVYGGYLAWK